MMASALYEQHGAYAAAPAPDAWGAQAGRTRLNALFEEAASRGPPTPLAAPPPPLLLARTPSQPPGYGYGSAPPPYVDPLAPRRRDGFAPGWPRVVGAAPPVVAPPSKQQLTAARQAAESGRVVWRSRADLLRRLAAREWLTRWVPLAAAAAGAGAAYAAVVVGTALCGCAAGTLGGFAAALLLAAALAATALACPPSVLRLAARWASGALVVALAPASLAAEAQLALRRGANASAAVAALPRDGLVLATASLTAPAVLLRGVNVRLDLMGEGVSLWPILRAGREATPVSWERRGVTPSSDAATGTFCVVPLVPSSGWDRATTAPPAWVACDNGWAGVASCAVAMNRTYDDGDSDAHALLADCLARLVQLNASLVEDSRSASPLPSNVSTLLFYAAGGPLDERVSWAGADAAAAAPAVRRAALSYSLAVPPEAYANAVVLRFAGFGPEACGACTHAGPAARHAATVAGAVVIVLLLAVAWGAALLDADAALVAGIAAEASRNASRLPRGAPEWWLEADATRILRRLWALADTAYIALMDRLLPAKTRREAQERLTFAMQVRQLAQMKRPLESLRKRLAKPMRLTGPERAREQLFATPREQSGHQPVSKPPPRRSR